MECFVSQTDVRRFIVRLDKDDLMLESILKVIEEYKIRNAVVISGIGTLSDATIHMVTTTTYPAVETFPRWENVPIELSSVSGIIADGQPHLHMVFSDIKGTYGGHMEPGCRILYLGELVIEELPIDLVRRRDEKNILVLSEK